MVKRDGIRLIDREKRFLSLLAVLLLFFLEVVFRQMPVLHAPAGGPVSPDSSAYFRVPANRHVILMIGDGMGFAHLEAWKEAKGSRPGEKLFMEELPYHGSCVTASLSGLTDSAAAGTALSTGCKTWNGVLGYDGSGALRQNLCELAAEKGRKTGVVTTKSVLDATPAAFTAHAMSRMDIDQILLEQRRHVPDLLMGGGDDVYRQAVTEEEKTELAVQGIVWAHSWETAASVCSGKLLATVSSGDMTDAEETPTLAQMTEKALDFLDGSDQGFFLMIEGGIIDSYSHKNNMEKMLPHVAAFDEAVGVAFRYVLQHPDTILVVTADHETGGLVRADFAAPFPSKTEQTGDYTEGVFPDDTYATAAPSAGRHSSYVFTTHSHTDQNVPLFAAGQGCEYFENAEVDNTLVAKFLARAMGEESFGD